MDEMPRFLECEFVASGKKTAAVAFVHCYKTLAIWKEGGGFVSLKALISCELDPLI